MSCQICFQSDNDEYIRLTNGKEVHQSCIKSITDKLTKAQDSVSAHKNELTQFTSQKQAKSRELKSLENKLSSSNNAFNKMMRFLFNETLYEIEASIVRAKRDLSDYEEKINLKNKIIQEITNQLDHDLNQAIKKLAEVYDFYPTYPPDWDQRRFSIIERDKVCLNCNKPGSHIHHIIPLDKGGSNLSSNLKLLCEKCHSKIHGFKVTSSERNERYSNSAESTFLKKTQALEKAIQNRKDVSFIYTKKGESKGMLRRVTPTQIISVDHYTSNDQTLCLKGFCHIRKAERVFAIKRMTDLKEL